MPEIMIWTLSGFQFLIFVYLLLGSRSEIARQMPLMAVFVWWSLFHHVSMTALWALTTEAGPLYFHAYYLSCLIHFGFLTALIIEIHRRCGLGWTWRSSVMLALFLAVFAWHFLRSSNASASGYMVAITLFLHVDAFLCAALNLALAYSSGVDLGRVRGAALWAISAVTILNYVVYITPAFDLLPYAVMRHLIPWVSLLFWLLLLYGLRFKPEEDFQTARPKTRTT